MASEEPGALNTGLATVTFGTITLLLATLVLIGATFASRVLIVRSVSTSAWNAFSLGYAVTQVLLAVGSYGVTVATARSLPHAAAEDERRTIVRTSIALGASTATICGVGLFLAAPSLSRSLGAPEFGAGLGFFAIAIASLILASVLASIFQGFSNVVPNALFLQIVNPSVFVAFLGLAFLLPPHHLTYTDTLVAYASACVVALAGAAAYALRRLPTALLKGPTVQRTRRNLVYLAAPLFIYGTMASIAGSGDTLILGALHYAQVGSYSASLTLARLVQVGISAASYIFLPVASGFLARGNRRAMRLTYATITKWLTLFSLPLFVVFALLPSSSLRFVYGANYAQVVLPLQVLVAGAFLATLLGPASMGQVAAGQARLIALNATAAAATDVVLGFTLIPSLGETGAAVAWAASSVLYAALCLIQLALSEGVHPFRRDFLVPLAVTGVPVSLVFVLLRPHLSVLGLIATPIAVALGYIAVVLATGSYGEGDRLLLGAVERTVGFRIPLVRTVAAWFGARRG